MAPLQSTKFKTVNLRIFKIRKIRILNLWCRLALVLNLRDRKLLVYDLPFSNRSASPNRKLEIINQKLIYDHASLKL